MVKKTVSLRQERRQTMAKRYEGKVLFSIFIVDGDVSSLEHTFPPHVTAKENAVNKFGPNHRVEQAAAYYGDPAGILVGVADGYDLVEITAENQPQFVGMDSESGKSQVVEDFIASVVEQAGLDRDTPCTWYFALLKYLNNGFGPLRIGGMGGISGGG